MLKSFGEVLRDKAIELRYPKDHNMLSDWIKQYPLPILGCSKFEIEELCQKQKIQKLPTIYFEFMRFMGKESGDLFIGYDIIYYYLKSYNFRESLNIRLTIDGYTPLNNGYYVFMNLGGHSFWYFSVDESNDPPVYMYIIDDGEDDPEYPCDQGPIIVDNHLSSFLAYFIEERASLEEKQDFLTEYASPYRSGTR